MKAKEILSHVDHTLLKQTATWQDIERICDEAVQYHTATVMVPSCYVKRIKDAYGAKLKVATVVALLFAFSLLTSCLYLASISSHSR